MMKKILSEYWHYGVLFVVAIFIIYVSGLQLEFSQMPNLKGRVLSLMATIPEGFVPVVDVIDGDTIVVLENGKEKTVRLLGVDTPEVRDPRRPVQCFGKQASAYTKELLMDRAVKLLPDSEQTDTDKYGRLLRYVYLEDGTTVNERLVYEGYAFAYEEYPTARTTLLKQMEEEAKKNKRGLWGACETTIKNGGKSKSTNPVSK